MSDFREYLLPARTEAPYFDGTDQEHHGECVNLPSQVQCTESGRRRTGMRSPPATYNEGGTQPDQRFVMICGEIEAPLSRRPTPDNRFPLSILLSPQLRGRHPLLITTATATLRSTALAFLRPHSLPDILSSAPDGIPSPIHIQIRAIRRLTGALPNPEAPLLKAVWAELEHDGHSGESAAVGIRVWRRMANDVRRWWAGHAGE